MSEVSEANPSPKSTKVDGRQEWVGSLIIGRPATAFYISHILEAKSSVETTQESPVDRRFALSSLPLSRAISWNKNTQTQLLNACVDEAYDWLKTHPNSEAARIIADPRSNPLDTPLVYHLAFVEEMFRSWRRKNRRESKY